MDSSDDAGARPAAEHAPAAGAGVARSASKVALAVFLSRILGLVREQVFAAFFGAGAVFDAFVTAFRVPNLFRDLLAEGALSAAFVKTFARKQEQEGAGPAFRLASLVFTALCAGVSLFVLFGVLAAPWLVDAIAPGFAPEKRALAVELTRLMFPFLLLVSLAAVAMGVLNARGVFFTPALAGFFFNAGSLVVGLGAAWLLEPGFMGDIAAALFQGTPIPRDPELAARAIFGMAAGVLAGGACQVFLQVPALRRSGFRFRPALDLRDKGLKEVLALMGPAVLGSAAVQVNVFVNTNFASRLEDGAVSWLSYAFRFMQFPIGLFGVAIATATLPAIARAAARHDRDAYQKTLGESLRLALFLTVPSAVGLVVLRNPIVELIYERGHFDALDTEQTAAALACYAAGLIGSSLVKILAPAFYALDDSRTPARVALVSIALNYALCMALVGPLGHRGLALSTALVALANAAALLLLLRVRIQVAAGARAAADLSKLLVGSALLGLTCWFLDGVLVDLLPGASLLAKAARLIFVIAAGGVVFLGVCRLLGLEEARRAGRLLRLRRGGR